MSSGRKRLIIMTVGTSLLSNTGGKSRAADANITSLNNACGSSYATPCDIEGPLGVFTAKAAVSTEVGYMCPSEVAKPESNRAENRLPQELTYLALIARRDCDAATVALLPTDTKAGRLCAEVIAKVVQLADEPWSIFQLHTTYNGSTKIPGLRATGDTQKEIETTSGVFEKQGIPNLLSALLELAGSGEWDEVLINLTGGFKGVIPYTSLVSAFLPGRVKQHYLFERTQDILELPAYPIGLDFPLWHSQRIVLKAYAKNPSMYGPILHDKLAAVAQEQAGSPSPYLLSSVLKEQYESNRSTDPIKTYSKAIVSRLLDDHPEYSNILNTLIDKSGDLIWLGDKVPDLVEHAHRHHNDLLEFTELFLTPILHVNASFLNARERFVLLSAVLLHDCGHAIDRISVGECRVLQNLFGPVCEEAVEDIGDEILLFPNDVREYHQFLAGIRLNNMQMAKELGWPHPSLPGGIDSTLHIAVTLTCLYHRRCMPYDKATPEIKQTLHLTGQIPKYLKDQKIAGIDLMKVVALMRIIDGCDSQNRRAGSSDRVRMTIAMLRRDGDTAAKRALAAYEAAVEVGQVDGLVKPGSGCKGGVSDPDRSKRIQHLKTANTLASRLWLLAAEALDQSAMKNAQEEHYAKHTFVDEIEIELQEGFSDENLAFRILLHQSATWKQEWPMADEPSTMQLVYDEVSGEYECVKDDASSRMKLGIDYKWA